MPSLIDGVFWGILLVTVGAWFILRRFLPFHFPVVRLIIAVLFISIGIRVLVHGPRFTMAPAFSESHQKYTPGWDRDYTILFGRGDIDLTGVTIDGADLRTRVNVVFASGVLHINPAVPVRIDMSAAFGTVDTPDGRSVSFGDSVYTTSAYRDGAPALSIHATAVFGRLLVAR